MLCKVPIDLVGVLPRRRVCFHLFYNKLHVQDHKGMTIIILFAPNIFFATNLTYTKDQGWMA